MQSFSEDVKEFHAALRAQPMFEKMIEEIEQNMTAVPEWTPGSEVEDWMHASSERSGQSWVISILKGEFYE